MAKNLLTEYPRKVGEPRDVITNGGGTARSLDDMNITLKENFNV